MKLSLDSQNHANIRQPLSDSEEMLANGTNKRNTNAARTWRRSMKKTSAVRANSSGQRFHFCWRVELLLKKQAAGQWTLQSFCCAVKNLGALVKIFLLRIVFGKVVRVLALGIVLWFSDPLTMIFLLSRVRCCLLASAGFFMVKTWWKFISDMLGWRLFRKPFGPPFMAFLPHDRWWGLSWLVGFSWRSLFPVRCACITGGCVVGFRPHPWLGSVGRLFVGLLVRWLVGPPRLLSGGSLGASGPAAVRCPLNGGSRTYKSKHCQGGGATVLVQANRSTGLALCRWGRGCPGCLGGW